MRQAADEVASGDLLRMLQLLLAQAALIIHRRHFQQNKAFRQPLGGQRQDVRTAIDNQRHFVIGKPLARLQTLLHQPDIQRKIAQQLR